MYEKVAEKGMGKKDFSVIYDLISKDQIWLFIRSNALIINSGYNDRFYLQIIN